MRSVGGLLIGTTPALIDSETRERERERERERAGRHHVMSRHSGVSMTGQLRYCVVCSISVKHHRDSRQAGKLNRDAPASM